jgi:hypothetical protein
MAKRHTKCIFSLGERHRYYVAALAMERERTLSETLRQILEEHERLTAQPAAVLPAPHPLSIPSPVAAAPAFPVPVTDSPPVPEPTLKELAEAGDRQRAEKSGNACAGYSREERERRERRLKKVFGDEAA